MHAIIYSLLNKLDKVVKYYRIHNVVIAGGVSANKYFRLSAVQLQNKYKLKIIFPDIEYCTDNAAMIAKAGFIMFKDNKKSKWPPCRACRYAGRRPSRAHRPGGERN